MSNLIEHAEYELLLAGLFAEAGDYGGMIAEAVLELVEVFSKQGHSGYSAGLVLRLFNEVANYRTLTPVGVSQEEWVEVGSSGLVGSSDYERFWQNKRRSSTFSRDGGKTWYDIDDASLNNGDVWKRERKFPSLGEESEQ